MVVFLCVSDVVWFVYLCVRVHVEQEDEENLFFPLGSSSGIIIRQESRSRPPS